jgi:hypothetical protein
MNVFDLPELRQLVNYRDPITGKVGTGTVSWHNFVSALDDFFNASPSHIVFIALA